MIKKIRVKSEGHGMNTYVYAVDENGNEHKLDNVSRMSIVANGANEPVECWLFLNKVEVEFEGVAELVEIENG